MTILQRLTYKGGIDKFIERINAEENINEQTLSGCTKLHWTVRDGKYEFAKALIDRGANPNLSRVTGETPLHDAIRMRYKKFVEYLLDSGADINFQYVDRHGKHFGTPLLCAVRSYPEIVPFLLDKGADPNIPAEDADYPLYWAVWKNNAKLVRVLLEAGSKVNFKRHNRETCLHEAVTKHNRNIVKILIKFGADPYLKDYSSNIPLFGVYREPPEIAIPIIKIFLEAGVSIDYPDEFGRTLASYAKDRNNQLYKDLLKLGAKEWPDASILDDDEDDMEDDEDDTEYVSIQFDLDEEIIEDKISTAKTKLQSLNENGWKASRNHWRLLRGFEDPSSVSRATYFARGMHNNYNGGPLDDGYEILGESYQDATQRFLCEELIAEMPHLVSMEKETPLSELKQLASDQCLKISGSRATLVSRLSKHMGENMLFNHLKEPRQFELTKKGKALILNEEPLFEDH